MKYLKKYKDLFGGFIFYHYICTVAIKQPKKLITMKKLSYTFGIIGIAFMLVGFFFMFSNAPYLGNTVDKLTFSSFGGGMVSTMFFLLITNKIKKQ